ncbi:MAG: branched-chain-amino-acid transaminase [Sediminibacterium sp.]
MYLHSIFIGMATTDFLFYKGKLKQSGTPLISPDNRSFRYGDGCFETMKMVDGKIRLAHLHVERLFASLDLLRFRLPAYFTPAYLEKNLLALARKNHHEALARIRLTVFRGDGGLYDAVDHFPHHLLQSWALNPVANELNENGLVMDIFTDARKVCDRYSQVKSNNYLSYVMAALWAKEQKLNDAILLNPYDRIADATIANVFIVKDGVVITPALTEGAVNGVMRRHLLHCLRKENMPVLEGQVTVDDVMQAAEVFLTNAMYGIRWVKQVGESRYAHAVSKMLYQQFIKTIA